MRTFKITFERLETRSLLSAIPIGPQWLAPPKGAIIVTPYTKNLDTIAYDLQPNATIYFTAGTYYDHQFEPKDGQTWLAQRGTILSSNKFSYAFECFANPASNVTIKNFVINGYLPPYQCGVIQNGIIGDSGSNWHLIQDTIKNCKNGGGAVLFDSQIIGCYIHNCDQIGFKLFGNSPSITYSHVSYNNLAHKFAVNDEAGGSKFWNTTDAVCSHNEFDHNVGCGIWLDFENSGAEIDHNYVHDNTYNGIYQEIGGSATIEYNTCNNNGTEYTLKGWLDGAGIAVEASHDVIVRNNTLNGNKNGIGLIASERGDPSWQIQNVVVTGNTVIGTKWQTGMCWDGVCPEPWAGATWTNNTYQLIAGSDFLMVHPWARWPMHRR